MTCQLVPVARSLVDLGSSVRSHLDLAANPSAVPEARRFLRARLAGNASDEIVDDVLLVASEVVTNAVIHAGTAIHLGVTYDQNAILVTVQDLADPIAVERIRGLPRSDLDESGRGMSVISTLSDDFGWQPTPDRAGKLMWFVVRIPHSREHVGDPSNELTPAAS